MIISIISLVTGVISILYFLIYILYAGINNVFTFFWAVFGALCIAFSFLHRYILKQEGSFLKRMEQAAGVALLAGFVLFLVILGSIVSEAGKKAKPDADYVIVLGAHVYGKRMSTNLKYRIEAAYEYLEKNPSTKVVLSGGQGSGEEITEAEAMRLFLKDRGISEDRILIDETSTNTEENLRNSLGLIGDKEQRVVIVSNDFHIYRAKGIARKQGYENVEGIGSRTVIYTMPNCYVREVAAVLKYKICGQIK